MKEIKINSGKEVQEQIARIKAIAKECKQALLQVLPDEGKEGGQK